MDKNSASAREWHVRKALPEELKMVAEIERLSFSRPWSLESIKSFYYRKTSDIYVWRDRNRISGYIIAEHLLSLGHKHITYICTPIRPKEIGRIHRLAGLRSCFKDHGLDPEWVEVKSPTIAAYGRYSADNSEYQNGYDMASQALDEHTSSTAFVGNNDMTAFGIMAAISDHGFRVPHDYSVCGFDNIPLSSMPQIALTTIEHASLAKGREAVDIIYKKNTQKNISAKHHYIMRMEYEPELIVRNSTGKCKITNKTKECHNIS